MGAWGEGPTDNDTAADMESDLGKVSVYNLVVKGLASDDEHEQRFAAWLIAAFGDEYIHGSKTIREHVILALEKMQTLIDNSEWIKTWRSETKIRQAIKEQIIELSRLSS